MSRGTWIGTGWKMNKNLAETEDYAAKLIAFLLQGTVKKLNIFIVPPFTVLRSLCDLMKGTDVMVGAQNMHWELQGAFTGEISPLMIMDCGAQLVELGHSERRAYFGETDYTVNKKVLSALKVGLRPLICVGEPTQEKERGTTGEFVLRQVRIALHRVSKNQISNVLLAYEPVWAIGDQGIPAEPQYANRIHQLIRELLIELYDGETAVNVPILYGGSVDHDNARVFIDEPEIDGLFVGRAAWQAESFIQLLDLISEFINSS
ncbi:MAG: triose-phosphate isomerase [Anaerolineales bacterium]|nr:triose-phosphate isomerase [Anaerolineales bacterium]